MALTRRTFYNPATGAPTYKAAPGVAFITPNRMVDVSPSGTPLSSWGSIMNSARRSVVGNTNAVGRGVAGAVSAVPTSPPTTPTVTPSAAPTVPTPAPPVDNSANVGVPTGSPVSPFDVSPFVDQTKLPLPKTFPTVDINSLYAPAERVLASQRNAALAGQQAAVNDNQAFETFLQNQIQGGNQKLAGTMGQLSTGANQSRQQSIDNITGALQNMGTASGGNADLQRLAGSTAASESNPLLQAGQSSLNAVPDLVGKANLQYAQDQTGVGAATGRVMNDAAIQAAQKSLSDVAQQQLATEQSKASAGLQATMNTREYMINVAQLNALKAMNAGTLSVKGYTAQTAMMGQIMRGMSAAQVAAQAKKYVAQGDWTQKQADDMVALQKVAAQQRGATNRTILKGGFDVQAAAARAARTGGSNMVAKGNSLGNNILKNLTQSYGDLNRAQQGSTAQMVMGQIATSFGANAQRPGGITYQQALDMAASLFPGGGSNSTPGTDLVRDPQFLNYLKGQFPQG